jgi:anti-sigma factor RsiW
MPEETTVATDALQLSPRRIAALARWLEAANRRLISLERGRRELIAMARSISDELEPRRSGAKRQKQPKRPKLAAKLAETG